MEMYRIQKIEGNRMKSYKIKINEKLGLASLAAAGLAAGAFGMAPVPGKKKQQTPTQQVEQEKITYADDVIKNMLIQDEGIRTEKYKDTKGIDTVGIGHNLGNEKQSIAQFNTAFGKDGKGVRDRVMSGGKLTDDEAKKLFDTDYEEHRNRTVKLIPKLHTYSPEVQAVLVSGTYRGHVGDSPNFRKLFIAGDYEKAANELLNRDELKEKKTKEGKVTYTPAKGVVTRMNRDADVIRSYGKKLEEERKAKEKAEAEKKQKETPTQQK